LQFAADEGPEHVDRDVEGAATILGSLVEVIGATVEPVEVRAFTVDNLVSPVVEINETLIAISLLVNIPKLTGGAIKRNHYDAVESVRALVVTVVEGAAAVGDIELVAVVAVAVAAAYPWIGKDPGEADVPAAATVAIGSVAGGASEYVSAGSPTATARMLALGLIVLFVIASAAKVIATAIVSAPVISVATIIAAAVLALVRTDSVGSVGAAIIVSAVISATIVVSSVVVTSVIAAGLTLIRSSAIDSLLIVAITAGLALIGAATSCSIATGVSILGAVAAGLAAIARGAFFLCVVTRRESHLGR
jgi:hypothetical protein